MILKDGDKGRIVPRMFVHSCSLLIRDMFILKIKKSIAHFIFYGWKVQFLKFENII